ncbi:unnamed protein product [Rotaria magnacalcarata]|uniref:Uncharacterized protein n=1 Tax=Rotaria magnacalcarata TaxID=392030 RepID=A0A816NGE3_9BILA|nr:unnamed protein product [Rotaria magnacalcarata]CAF2159676.1 unnamed protein product [Rotaria magnacalcarata]CAF4096297.1 unnamed protein product [Rotaria magnacalcarata]CAF4216862.1 unnamed protein product [Rotaria magnacalcarata]
MNNPIYHQWQQWESQVLEWLNRSDEDLTLPDTDPFDRVILTLLTVKYQIVYKDMDKETAIDKEKKQDECKSTVILSKIKTPDVITGKEDRQDKEKLLDDFTDRLLSPEQVSNENSTEWQGLEFVKRSERCLAHFVSQLISANTAYQEFIREPSMISPVTKINNRVYTKKNDGQMFLTIDMKSANFASLQQMNFIDAHMYPTWDAFLSTFVGSTSLFLQNKHLRMMCLGKLPAYNKLEAFWTHFTGTIYQTVLCPYLDELGLDVRCIALEGDEVVFHLDASIEEDKVRELVENLQIRLANESPIIKFHVQAYRLRAFHWQNKHMCFARMFIGQDEAHFDLKCVPERRKNYNQAYADFRTFSGL